MGPIFGKTFDKTLRLTVGIIGVVLFCGGGIIGYLALPQHIEIGYQPKQPVPYSHKLHAGNLGMDCRYCHFTVERSSYAAVPPSQVCMNCHARVRPNSDYIKKIKASYDSGKPMEWVKIHQMPDYVYFNHKAHVRAGVSCVSCHGRVDQMIEVKQVEPMTMAWCLDCHRNPESRVRPADLVTKLDWKPERNPAEIGRELIAQKGIHPPTNCSGCHR
jgi:menaquinone reductase, multiheme cytochrome c subunit